MKKNILLIVAIVIFLTSSKAQNVINGFWETNGQVHSTLKQNNKLFIGGEFSYIGPSTGCLGAFNTGSGQIAFNNIRISGQVNAMTSSNNGSIFLGGDFSINGGPRLNIAKFDSLMNYDATFQFTLDGAVQKMVIHNNSLFIYGQFGSINSQVRNNFAAIDLATNSLSSFAPNPDGQINTLVSANGVLFVGGNFNIISGIARSSFAAYDGSKNLLPLNLNVVGSVSSITLSDSLLFVAGMFDTIAGNARTNLASFNAITGTLRPWRADVVGTVNEMAINGNTLYLAGNFYQVGIQIRNNLAAVNTLNGAVSSFNPGVDSEIKSMKIKGSNLYIGGSFSFIGSNPKQYLAAVSMGSGTLTGDLPKTNGEVSSLLWSGQILLSSGSFSSYGGINAHNFAALNYLTGEPIPTSLEIDGPIYDLEMVGTELLIAGNFNSVNNTSRTGVAMVDTALFIPNSWNPNCDGAVRDVLLFGNTIYLAGDFTHLGNDERNYLALVNSTTGAMNSWNPNPNGSVNEILLNYSQLYIKGDFTQIGSTARKNIASFDLSNNGSLRAWSINADSVITDMAFSGNAIIIGGLFNNIGSTQRNYIAAIDTASTASILNWAPQLNGPVLGLEHNSGFVYVGGNFSTNLANGFACFQLSNSLEINFPVKLESGFASKLINQGNRLYISGEFALANTGKQNFAAIQLSVESPTIPCANLTLLENLPNALRFKFTKGNGSSSLVIAKESNPVDTFPSNGNGYTANSTFGNGQTIGSNFVIYSGEDTTFTVTGLNPNTNYQFAVFTYNGIGNNSVYLSSNPARASHTTIIGYNPPSVAASAILFSDISMNKMTLKWTKGNGSNRYVVLRESNPVDKIPSDSISYNGNNNFGNGEDLGSGNFIVYSGSQDSIVVTGLKASTTYHAKVYEYNGIGIFTRVLSTAPSANATTLTPAIEPNIGASTITFSNITANSMKLAWTPGNGSGRIIVASKEMAVLTLPTDGETYFTDNSFNGASSYLSNNERVVYIGTGNEINITGLEPNTNYHFAVIEFNGNGYTINYQSTAFASANRSTKSDLNFPTVPSKNITFANTNLDSMEISWSPGNGEKRLVLMRKSEAVLDKPTQGITYAFDNKFGFGDTLLDGSSVVYFGSLNTLLVYNLEPNTTYHIAIFEMNNSLNGPLYLYDSFAIASNKTLNPVGLHKIKGTGSIQVYPNPSADGKLTLNFGKLLGPESTIMIYDFSGRTILDQKLLNPQNGVYPLQLPNIVQGEYLVKVISGGEYFLARITIQ